MKKLIFAFLAALLLIGSVGIASAASLGSGVRVIANDVNLIKTGIVGNPIRFSDADFKSALCCSDFKSITVTALPEEKDGTLMLADRELSAGQTIRRRNLGSLSFIPASASVSQTGFKFTVDGLCAGAELECILKFTQKVNYAPKVNTDSAVSLPLTTQEGISLYGKLSATDPEDDDIDYIIVSYPKNGTLGFTGSSEGEYRYTPSASYRGNDSFVYVVRDEYGNYSEAQRVSLRVTERMSPISYADVIGRREENAVIAMTAMGVMSGTAVGDGMYFNPDAELTRAEFVAMAMKAAGLRADSTLTKTFFDDNDKIPAALVGYVATAQKCGIVNGAFEVDGLYFRPNDAITKYEASIIMSKLIASGDEEVGTSFENMYTVPVWARDEVGTMLKLGIFDADDSANAKTCVTRASAAEYLYRLCNLNAQ